MYSGILYSGVVFVVINVILIVVLYSLRRFDWHLEEGNFFYFLLWMIFGSLFFAIALMTLGVLMFLGANYGWQHWILGLVLVVVFWAGLIWKVDYFRNVAGDLLNHPRCYNCNNSHFLRKKVSIPLNTGSQINFCSDCGNPENIDPVRVYCNVFQFVGPDKALLIEKSLKQNQQDAKDAKP